MAVFEVKPSNQKDQKRGFMGNNAIDRYIYPSCDYTILHTITESKPVGDYFIEVQWFPAQWLSSCINSGQTIFALSISHKPSSILRYKPTRTFTIQDRLIILNGFPVESSSATQPQQIPV